MNTAEDVSALVNRQKDDGVDPQQIVWDAALACVGWPYVFGARGDWCDPENRRSRYRDDHPTIQTSCKAFSGGSCSGCKWYPGGKRVRAFDCRGFTYYWLKQVYGWTLDGTGATSQWNNAANWLAKGEISTVPDDTLVCLFVRKGDTMDHTGFGFHGQTVECSAGVQHFDRRKTKWTHWAIPACIGKPVPRPDPQPDPDPDTKKPTLRKGFSGPFVTLLQTKLIQRGYALEKYGADGKYGAETAEAVKAFQHDHPPLVADGICGPMTWEEIDNDYVPVLYTVTIPHLAKHHADALIENYAGATMVQEGGRT